MKIKEETPANNIGSGAVDTNETGKPMEKEPIKRNKKKIKTFNEFLSKTK